MVKKFNVVDMNGQHVSEIELSDAVFGITRTRSCPHCCGELLANRQGTQNTKIRMEVSGGGQEALASEGAPATLVRAPSVLRSGTHGGVALGPKPRSCQLPHQQQGQASGSAERPVRQGCQWQHGRR